ncbi:hypothetical protein PSI23_22555, partial [Xenorhabdus sp. XENO-10]|nr:hypothetical protein [Xenorhabdus yunnanensis]
ETTQIYTRVAIGHLKKVHRQTHPAERADNQQPDADTGPPESRSCTEPAESRVSDSHAGASGQPARPR